MLFINGLIFKFDHIKKIFLFQMAANALEEKINKIRLQNEEIKRRYEVN